MEPTELLKWVGENKVITILVVWPVFSALLNIATRYHKAEDWVRLAEESPRTVAIIKFIRAIGLDPVKALQALISFVQNRAIEVVTPAPKPPEPTPAPTPSPEPNPAPASEEPKQ
jgi:hypothetical protein